MPSITAFLNKNSVNIKQTRVKREWMDKTFSGHAYRCFPLSLANSSLLISSLRSYGSSEYLIPTN